MHDLPDHPNPCAKCAPRIVRCGSAQRASVPHLAIWASKMRRAELCEAGIELRFFGGLRGPGSLLHLPALAPAGPAPAVSLKKQAFQRPHFFFWRAPPWRIWPRRRASPASRAGSAEGSRGPAQMNSLLLSLGLPRPLGNSRPRPYTMDQAAGCNGWKGRAGELSIVELCICMLSFGLLLTEIPRYAP